ncbi:MAG: COQ9 family protein [Caulobacteraceae bacterium]|nr:COQ9 family protein [Caulobacter sp.]
MSDRSESGVDPIGAIEARLLDAALRVAPVVGWRSGLLEASAREAGVSPVEATLLMPDGTRDLSATLFARHDAAAMAVLAAQPYPERTSARIRLAVMTRAEAAMADEAAVRRASAYLALPQHAALGARLTWATADRLWRWAGDTATDENHYSKRAILSGVLVSVIAAWLRGGRAMAEETLDRRLRDVAGFERWKASLPTPAGWAQAAASALGALRYGRDRAPEPAPYVPPRLTDETGPGG